MKIETMIDSQCEEKIVIYARERTQLVEDIERLVSEKTEYILGYADGGVYKLKREDVYCFCVEDGKIFAVTRDGRRRVKERLYELEAEWGSDFLKINQSCLVNFGKIERFESSIGGSLSVVLSNGYRDYISRRQIKAVKERIGF